MSQSTAFQADESGGSLLQLPSALWGKIWPAGRVVAGFRVCKLLSRELSKNAGSIVLRKRFQAAIHEDALVEDFGRVSHLKVFLQWTGQEAGLDCIASLSSALTHLDFSYTTIGPKGAGILAGALSHCPALTYLDLSWNEICVSGERAEIVAGVLGGCKALVHLALRGNEIGSVGAMKLAEILVENKTIEFLDLCSNFIGDWQTGSMEWKRFAGILGGCKALAHLDLSENELGNQGAGSLAEILGGCKVLACLDLSSNCIGDEGAEKLAGVMGECKALERLDLSENEFGLEVTERLRLEAVKVGCRVQMDDDEN